MSGSLVALIFTLADFVLICGLFARSLAFLLFLLRSLLLLLRLRIWSLLRLPLRLLLITLTLETVAAFEGVVLEIDLILDLLFDMLRLFS